MAAKKDELVADSADQDFVISRVIAAPRALVFAAWTDARHLAAWWGPRGFSSRCEVDARPGGAYRIVMRGPDGVEYPMKGLFREVVAPERLVYSADLSEHPDAWHDLINPARDKRAGRPALETVTTVTFVEAAGKTTLTLRTRFASKTLRDAFVKTGMNEGWSQSLERLGESLAPTADREILATRLFNAPRELVWRTWTEREHVAKWWGPRGFTNTIQEMDVRPGGVWQLVMHGPDGTDYLNTIVYSEVVAPERLAYEHVSGPRFFMTATFAAEGNKTRLSVRMLFDTAAQRDKVAKEFGAVEGLAQTLDRLGELLAK